MMKIQRFLIRVVSLIFFVLLLLSISGCTNDAELKVAYLDAVDDARVAEPDEICRNLEAIVYYNPDLIWEGKPGESRVLLVTWTKKWDGYVEGASINLAKEIWGVIPEELLDFYKKNRSLSDDDLVLRLKQLYGIPPDDVKDYFVEIWVDPDDLFRPSPDPEVTDCEAELDFRKSVDTQHRDWFNNKKITSYDGEKPYPWTRLGYTYDWGNQESEIGLSEFIIRIDSSVKIESVTDTLEYFGK
jgi:hypothetical protein